MNSVHYQQALVTHVHNHYADIIPAILPKSSVMELASTGEGGQLPPPSRRLLKGRKNNGQTAGNSQCPVYHKLMAAGHIMQALLNQHVYVAHEVKIFVLGPHDSLQIVVLAFIPPECLQVHIALAVATAILSEHDHHHSQECQRHLDHCTLPSGTARQQAHVYLPVTTAHRHSFLL